MVDLSSANSFEEIIEILKKTMIKMMEIGLLDMVGIKTNGKIKIGPIMNYSIKILTI